MRTTLNIDDHLLEKAAKLTGIEEKTSWFVWAWRPSFLKKPLFG